MSQHPPPPINAEEPVPPEAPEPRWPALVAILAAGGLFLALPPALTLGPRWLFPGVVLALLIPTIVSHHRGHDQVNALLGVAVVGVLTVGMGVSVFLLVQALPAHKEAPEDLLRSAASLWATNILVFALWYWRLDAGGPHQREKRAGHPEAIYI